MKLETFFEKFDQFADAPDAVAKMRELVLHLAVTGKLSEHTRAWTESSLGEVSRLRRGYDLPTQDRKKGSVPIFAANGPVGVHEIHMVKGPGVVTGRSGSIGKVHFVDKDFWPLNTALYVQDFFGNYPQFICLLLRSLHLERFSTATAVPTLNRNVVHKELVKVPPLREQKRIVAKVDELMALCDRLEAQQQERETRHVALARASLARFADAPTPTNLQFLFHPSYAISPADLRKSILTVAVQGKLVRFKAENDARTVGDHIAFQNGYAFKSQWFKPEGTRLCRNVNVSHGVVDWRESVFVDEGVAKEFERFALSEGDIVLSLDRPLITTGLKVARIRKQDLPCLLLQRVAKPVPKHDQLDMSYFLLWLNSSEFLDSIDPGRSNGVPHISTRQVQLLPFVLPPLVEQRRIVEKVEQLMSLVDELETQLAASRASAANLLCAIVTELTGATRDAKVAVASVSGAVRLGRPKELQPEAT